MITKFAANIKNFIEQHNEKKLILTVSGGPDSVCLIDLFNRFKDNYELEIHVAHYNHQLRGVDALDDARFVENLAKNYGFNYHYDSGNTSNFAKNNSYSIEEAARIKRYNFFSELAENLGIKTIITGHHADDQIETVLLRMLQGASLDSLGGMNMISPLFCNNSIKIFRPFLDVWRWEIMKHLGKEHLSYRKDMSNQDNKFYRNKIRNRLIPILCEEFTPALKDNLFQLSALLREDIDLINSFIDQYNPIAKYERDKLTIDLDTIPRKSGMRKRILLKITKKSSLPAELITFHNLNKIDELLDQHKTSFSINLKYGYLLTKQNNTLVIEKNKSLEENFLVTLTNPGEIAIDKIGKVLLVKELEKTKSFRISKLNNPVHIDADKIKFPIKIRSRQTGDSFYPFGLTGHKKVKDYLIDKKINRFQRWQVPVIEDASGKIIWLGHYQIDDRVKVTEDTRNILELSIKKLLR